MDQARPPPWLTSNVYLVVKKASNVPTLRLVVTTYSSRATEGDIMIQSEVSLQEALSRVNRTPAPHQGLWSWMSLPDGGELEIFPLSATFLFIVYLTKRTNGIFSGVIFSYRVSVFLRNICFFLLNCKCLLGVFGVVFSSLRVAICVFHLIHLLSAWVTLRVFTSSTNFSISGFI